MEIKKTVTKEVEEIVDVICDKCGKSCNIDTNHSLTRNSGLEYLTISGDWGYFSNHDFETWSAHICQDCAEELAKVIKFEISNYFPMK